jgi:hydroxymethylpyrimidine/phosphomethylpyrimidine kinase
VLSGANEADYQSIAADLADQISTSVLITGGHDPDRKNATDTLYNYASGNLESFSQSYVDTPNTHGTGCTLSSAIACNLASGLTLQESARAAQNYIAQLLNWSRDIKVGQGQGPLPHHLLTSGH